MISILRQRRSCLFFPAVLKTISFFLSSVMSHDPVFRVIVACVLFLCSCCNSCSHFPYSWFSIFDSLCSHCSTFRILSCSSCYCCLFKPCCRSCVCWRLFIHCCSVGSGFRINWSSSCYCCLFIPCCSHYSGFLISSCDTIWLFGDISVFYIQEHTTLSWWSNYLANQNSVFAFFELFDANLIDSLAWIIAGPSNRAWFRSVISFQPIFSSTEKIWASQIWWNSFVL